jgi:NhaA family Na+:H+ antiporter
MPPVENSSPERIHAPLEKPAKALTEPFRDFVTTQSGSGWLLLGTTVLAIAFANSPWSARYFSVLHIELGVILMDHEVTLSLQHWVNDGLMAIFFFLLGLELKRELLVGQLSELRRTASVLCAAAGGMLVPAALFMTIGSADPIRAGWAIPLATDTAFALTLLVLLGRHVPTAARAFLVGLAIVDDLGAILVIALAYTSDFDVSLVAPAAGVIAALVLLNLIGVRGGFAYFVLGVVLWLLFLAMGLHGTLAGVVVALTAPVRPAIPRRAFVDVLMGRLRRFDERHDADTQTILEQPEQQVIADDIRHAAEQATAPLQRWERRLERPVSFIIVPLFAALNAGVVLDGAAIAAAWASPLSLAILAGLLIGKPAGIVLGVWLGRLAGFADLPSDLSWRHVIGLGLLGGIGFTMSLFIATLSYGDAHPELLEIAKQSVIGTSLCAGLLGFAWLRWSSASKP